MEESIKSKPKNISSEMYATNELYRTLCVLCNRTERYLVAHYSKHHQKHENFIARPSPKMATKLRLQTELFGMQNKKIHGSCFFCDEMKNMTKYHWASHILSHTGENIYACSTCHLCVKIKRNHKSCTTVPRNIFDFNTTDGSLSGFMCRECNYLQISRERIVKHLINEHGYHDVEESVEFEKVILVPDLSPLDVPVEKGFSMHLECTICCEHSENVEQFKRHFDQTHTQVEEYNCPCGERILSFDGSNVKISNFSLVKHSNFTKKIAKHLATHDSDLYQCMVCKDIFLNTRQIQDHLLNNHPECRFKYQHIHRDHESNQKISIAEMTITKMKCHICGDELQDGNFAQAITHFNRSHRKEDVHIQGVISKKLAQRNSIEMKHYAYVISF